MPLPGFEQLIEIILNTDYDEDRYGAASIILNIYPAQLLDKSETLLFNYRNYQSVRNIKVFIKVFHLDEPTNKSPTLGKSFDEISKDFERWKSISDYINKQINVE